MTTADPVLSALAEWAESREGVRALIPTSTRAVPDAELDAYSDYDVVVSSPTFKAMLEDLPQLAKDVFGEVLITYWDPLVLAEPATGANSMSAASPTTPTDLKIDFSLWSPQRYVDLTGWARPLSPSSTLDTRSSLTRIV